MLFNVKSLSTNVSTSNTLLRTIYNDKELETTVSRNDMKETLTLCTKNAHFTKDAKIFVQTNKCALGSPLGPILADISRNVDEVIRAVLKSLLFFLQKDFTHTHTHTHTPTRTHARTHKHKNAHKRTKIKKGCVLCA